MPPRRSLRASATPAKRASPAVAAAPPAKRRAGAATARTRRYFSGSKRGKGTGHDDEEDDDEDDEDEDDEDEDDEDEDEDQASSYNGTASPASTTNDDDVEDSDNDDEANASLSRSGRTAPKDIWRAGVKTGLGPGREVVFRKPTARSPGRTPYSADTIHPHTLLFLRELAAHNDREWLKRHDPDYRTSWSDFVSWLECLSEKVIEADETVPELPTKDLVFRIYRDVRFSSDPTPYKTHFSAAWSRTGRKGPFAAYYVQIKPGGSFVGGGLWQPEPSALAALRRSIDRHPERLKGVLLDERIRRDFFAQVPAQAAKAVKAFAAQNADSALKTKPKGFDADHKDIELLRLRNFTMGAKLSDDEVLGPQGLERVAEKLRSLVPFVTFLNSVVMPDEPASSDSDAASDDDGDA